MGKKIKLGKFEVDEEELNRQFEEATRRGEEELARAPKAVSAKYEEKTGRLVIQLENDVVFMIPADLIQGLCSAPAKDISEVELWMEGMYVHWEKLDVDFYVSDLMRGVFGTPKWMAEINSKPETEDELQKKVA